MKMLEHPILVRQDKDKSTKITESPCRSVRFVDVEKEREEEKCHNSLFDSRSDFSLEKIFTSTFPNNEGKLGREMECRQKSTLAQQGNSFWSEERSEAYINTMTDAYHHCLKGKNIPSSIEGDMEFYATTNYSKRGLEIFYLEQVRKERRKRRNKHCQCILNAQHNCLQNRLNFSEMSRILRLMSEKLSKPEKKYAKILAAADERVVLEDIKIERMARRSSI